MCPRTEFPSLFCLSLLIKVSCIHWTWEREEHLHLAGCNCILFLCWRWPCIWWMVTGHGRDRYSVASSLGAGAVYSSLGDCTIWPTRPLSPLSVPATLGHCPACCGWVSLAQQAALEWCVEDSWRKAGTVRHGHFSHSNPRIGPRHAKSRAAQHHGPAFSSTASPCSANVLS